MVVSRTDTRSGDALITQEYVARLGAVWPGVGRRVREVLAARGVDDQDAEDAAQETALRALRVRPAFVDADDLVRWAVVVAWHYAVDVRRRSRFVDPSCLPDGPSCEDVGHTVELREALRSVRRGMGRLTERERAALVAALTGIPPPERPADRSAAVREAVRRHRARLRLAAMSDGLLGAAVGLTRRVRPRRPPARLLPLAGTSIAVASFGGLALVWSGTSVGPARAVVARPLAAPVTPASRSAPTRPPYVPGPDGAGPTYGPGVTRAPALTAGAGAGFERAVPTTEVTIEAAGGSPGRLGTRPNHAGDRFVCVGPMVTGYRCLDYPPAVRSLWPHGP